MRAKFRVLSSVNTYTYTISKFAHFSLAIHLICTFYTIEINILGLNIIKTTITSFVVYWNMTSHSRASPSM